MITVENLLPEGKRDESTILAAQVVAGWHGLAVDAAMSALAAYHNQFRDLDDEDSAKMMAEATQHLLEDRATIEQTITELAELGGAATVRWKAASQTRPAARGLIDLTGQYVALSIRRAQHARRGAEIDRLEAAYDALGSTVRDAEPIDAG